MSRLIKWILVIAVALPAGVAVAQWSAGRDTESSSIPPASWPPIGPAGAPPFDEPTDIFPGVFGAAALPPPPPPLTRSMCEGNLDAEAAFVAYIESKLRLDAKQREIWLKIEAGLQPAREKLYSVCDTLPLTIATPPSFPEYVDVIEAQLSARLELIRAVREPVRELYATLSPLQLKVLQPPAPALPH